MQGQTYRCYHRGSCKVFSRFYVQFLETRHGHHRHQSTPNSTESIRNSHPREPFADSGGGFRPYHPARSTRGHTTPRRKGYSRCRIIVGKLVEQPRQLFHTISFGPTKAGIEGKRRTHRSSTKRWVPGIWKCIAKIFGADTDVAFKAWLPHCTGPRQRLTYSSMLTTSPDSDRWLVPYQEEVKSLKDMNVYKLVPLSTESGSPSSAFNAMGIDTTSLQRF